MKITTFKTESYRECPIYYRNFGHVFEYLVVIDGQIYTTHISVRPYLVTKILYWLGIEPMPYSRQQIGAILAEVRKLSETTIDFIKDKAKSKKIKVKH